MGNRFSLVTRAFIFFCSVLLLCGLALFAARCLGITDAEFYMPRRMCYRYDSRLVWINVITDHAIGLAYYVLPLLVVMIYYAEFSIRTNRKPSFLPRMCLAIVEKLKAKSGISWGRRMQHIGVYWLGFIFFCGTGHHIDGFGMWIATPWAKSVINIGTAITSWSAMVITAGHAPYFIKLFRSVAAIMQNVPRTWEGPL